MNVIIPILLPTFVHVRMHRVDACEPDEHHLAPTISNWKLKAIHIYTAVEQACDVDIRGVSLSSTKSRPSPPSIRISVQSPSGLTFGSMV